MAKQESHIYKLKTVRQHRRPNESGKLLFRHQGQFFEVRDYTAFSLSVFIENQGAKEIHGELFVSSTLIADLNLAFVRDDTDELGNKFSAFQVTSTPIDLTQVEAALTSHKMLIDHSQRLDEVKCSKIPMEFVVKTYELKAWLSSLERHVESIALKSFETAERELTEYENTVCQIVAHYLSEEFPTWFQALANAIKDSDEESIENAFNLFRKQVGPFLYQSYYSHRAYSKPLGYAGDFEMMNTVYLKDKRGDSLFARCIHNYFTDVPEARAVRNRAKFLYDKIEKVLVSHKNPVKILAVASGPAKELQEIFLNNVEAIPEGSEFHLLDQDENALQYSQKMLQSLIIKKNIKAKVILHRREIKEVIAQGIEIEDFDLIYSAGLFDYLSDPVATFAATTLYRSLAPKGELIIGNFNVEIPNEFGMALIMDWKLIYRSKDDLVRLFQSATKNIKVEEEPEGINLFAILDKNAA